MITQIPKSRLHSLEADDFYPLTSLVADKLRVIYTVFGWRKSACEEADNTLSELIEYCIAELRKGLIESNCATGGIKVEMGIDEDDMITLDVLFDVL